MSVQHLAQIKGRGDKFASIRETSMHNHCYFKSSVYFLHSVSLIEFWYFKAAPTSGFSNYDSEETCKQWVPLNFLVPSVTSNMAEGL